MMHTILECKLLLAYNYNDTRYSLRRGLLQIAKGIYINQKHLLPGSAQDTAVFVNYLSLFWIWHGRSLCACFTYSLMFNTLTSTLQSMWKRKLDQE